MEKEALNEKRGESLPVPAGLQKATADTDAATTQSVRRTKAFRFLAAAGLAVFIGSSAFSYLHRSLERQRLAAPGFTAESSLNPDLRGKLTVKEAEQLFLSIPDAQSAIATSKLYATLPHLAGSEQDFETAKDFLSLLQSELGISTPDEVPVFDAGSPESQEATRGIVKRRIPSAWIDKYFPVMNTPLGRALDIVDDEGTAVWKADVEEKIEEGDPASEHAHTIGAWHGLSAGGDVTGPAVYVNYGRKKDFDELAAAGVNLTGTIAVVRYGGVFRGLKVKAAQEAGCIGTLIYTDPRDHGSVTEEAGYKPYPEGPAVHPNSVQRGSVQYLSSYPGDPTTPGYPAYANATRTEASNIPKIPSLPISWENGKRILDEINPISPFTMDGTLSTRRIRLLNQVDTHVTPIWNTMAVIPGHIQDEVVIVGNHRDAWVNGAADPTSGTVAVVEIVKGLGSLLRAGWVPLRTIVIASWDAEEYGLIGSTEFGEDYVDFLKKHVVAYLNVDVATGGSRLSLGGSPSLAHLVKGAAQSVTHPTDANRTLWDAREDAGPFTGPHDYEKELGADLQAAVDLKAEMQSDPYSTGVRPLGSGSDYTVFLQRIGIASIDGGFSATHSDAVYHYHSVYDSHQWQERYADPGFVRHVAIAKYLGLVTLRVADSIVLPLNTTQYTLELESYLTKVEALAVEQSPSPDFSKLRKAISKLQKSSSALDHAKFKAEKKLRKALSNLGKKKSRKDRRHACTKRRWRKLRNFVKGVFGVSSTPAHEHTHDHAEKENLDHHHEHVKRSEERGALLDKIRVGKAGAGKLVGNQRRGDSSLQKRDESVVGEARSQPADRGRGLRRSRPCTRHHSQEIWSLPADHAVPNKGPLRKVFKAAQAVRHLNAKLASFEGGFISEAGIKDREWYRHLGVAPGKWLGYGATTFPALTEALDERNSTLATVEAERLAELVTKLAHFLKP